MVYKIVNPKGESPVIFVCEHASNNIPPEYQGLGLKVDILSKHVAFDIGAREVAIGLSEQMNACAVLANFSRLLIDPNRIEDHPHLIPEQSDGIIIPGNQNLCPKDRDKRLKQYHNSFHAGLKDVVNEALLGGQRPIMLGIHSFTPQMDGQARPWPISIMWNTDERASSRLIAGLRAQGHDVGLNEPYSGKELFHTMNVHGGGNGLSHALIEIRQDQINDKKGIDIWVQNLIPVIKSLFDVEELFLPHP
jgi:predicted N-formylglutamate amidohydrolase